MRLRAIASLGLTVFLLSFGVAGAASAAGAAPAYPPPTCSTLAVDTTNPLPGDPITVTGSSFTPNADIRLELHSKTYVLGRVTSNAQGAFSTQVTLPAGVTGSHLIVAIGGDTDAAGCPADPSQQLRIQTDGDNAGTNSNNGADNTGGTAFTGVNVLIMLLAAAALIAAGVAFNRRGQNARAGAGRR